MSIETGKRSSFQKKLVLIIMLISFCIQLLFLGYGASKFEILSKRIVNDSTQLAHQMMRDNVDDVARQLETLLSFVQWNNITQYAEANLNLRDEEYVLQKFERMKADCKEAEITPDIIQGFLLVGRNFNQKSLYYDFADKSLQEYILFEQEILEEIDHHAGIVRKIGFPMKMETQQAENILQHYDKEKPEYDIVEKFVEQCTGKYVVTDVISDVIILVFFNEDCFTEGLTKLENFHFALYGEEETPILNYGSKVSEHATAICESQIFPEGLRIVTTYESELDQIHKKTIFMIVIYFILSNLLSFLLATFLAKKMFKPFHLFKNVVIGKKASETIERKKSFSLGSHLGITLLLSCVIPFIALLIVFNLAVQSYGKMASNEYLNYYTIYCRRAEERFEGQCIQVSSTFALPLLQEYSVNNPENNRKLIQNFEKNMLIKGTTLPDYQYAVLLDRNHAIVHQTIYSGQERLFVEMVHSVLEKTASNQNTKQILRAEDPVSTDQVYVLSLPVSREGDVLGTLLIVLGEQAIDSYNKVGYTTSVSDNATLLKGLASDGITIGMIMVIILIMIAYFMLHLIVTPIANMTKKFSRSKGVPETLDINTGVKEINDMIVVYNDMVERQIQLQKENENRHDTEKYLIELRSQAEFKMLQQQINPHFMFNSLEIINLLASMNHLDNISNIAKALAEILRFSLNQRELVTVGEEIDALRNYFLIQHIRFGDRIHMEINCDEQTSQYTILKLILQPLVENAISHGVYHSLHGGKVTVTVTESKGNLEFVVSDNGAGMTEEQLQTLINSIYDDNEERSYSVKGSGIGLKNIYRRLRLYYGEQAKMEIQSKYKEGTIIRLVLPKEEEQ